MRNVLPAAFVILATAWFGPVPAAADPISLNYRVTVFQKLDITRSLTDWQPITPITFNYSVRFDGDVASQRLSDQGNERYAFTYFGAPDVSNIPLVGAGFSGGMHTAQTYVLNATLNGLLHQEALTFDQFSEESAMSGGSRNVLLSKLDLNPPLPPDVFGDLGDFLRAMHDPTLAFYFSDIAYTRDGNAGGPIRYLPGSTTYFGSVVSLDAAAVPEPGTITLLALGLSALGPARRIRRRRANRC